MTRWIPDLPCVSLASKHSHNSLLLVSFYETCLSQCIWTFFIFAKKHDTLLCALIHRSMYSIMQNQQFLKSWWNCFLSKNSNLLTMYGRFPNLAKLHKTLEKKTILPLVTTHIGLWQPHTIVHHVFNRFAYLNTINYTQNQKTKLPWAYLWVL